MHGQPLIIGVPNLANVWAYITLCMTVHHIQIMNLTHFTIMHHSMDGHTCPQKFAILLLFSLGFSYHFHPNMFF